MKRIAVIGLLLALTTGCGRGWLPTYWNGAPCDGCALPPPIHTQKPCNTCTGDAVSLGYAPYDGQVIGTGIDGYYDGQVISENVIPGTVSDIAPLGSGSATRN